MRQGGLPAMVNGVFYVNYLRQVNVIREIVAITSTLLRSNTAGLPPNSEIERR